MRPYRVTRSVEFRRKGRDAHHSGQHADDSAADAGFGRNAGGEDPVAGVFVESDRSDHRDDLRSQLGVEDLLLGDRVDAAVGDRAAADR